MTSDPLQSSQQEFPASLPIFPLTGVLLLPRGQLPLNIFEPRYMAMIDYALGQSNIGGNKAGRMIGMVQPQEATEEQNQENPPVYKTGCVGRIISFSESGDGRYLITLLGMNRFKIMEELDLQNGFRHVRPDFTSFGNDLVTENINLPNREQRLEIVKSYFTLKNIAADWSSIEDAPDEPLITSLAMMCPFAPSEKQALLECSGLQERSALLISLMEMAVHDNHDSQPTQTH